MDENKHTTWQIERQYGHGEDAHWSVEGDGQDGKGNYFFEDDANEAFNEVYRIWGHNTYFRLVERKVIRHA